nr:dCTP pyrophosphatase 1-like [Ipomoea batatas]
MTGEEGSVSLDLLKKKMNDFAKERDWEKFHSPRNLLLAMKQNPSLFCCSIKISFVYDERNLQSLSDKFRWSLDYHVKSDQVEKWESSQRYFNGKGEGAKGAARWEETGEDTPRRKSSLMFCCSLVRLSDQTTPIPPANPKKRAKKGVEDE